jgi:hypothetical protein
MSFLTIAKNAGALSSIFKNVAKNHLMGSGLMAGISSLSGEDSFVSSFG